MKPEADAGATRVLYLDDDDSLVLLVTMRLERAGWRVCGETDSETALAKLRAAPAAFDLLVTDHNMPGRSGLEVAREMLVLNPNAVVVLVSGYVDALLRAQALAAGVYRLILKPATATDLCAILAGIGSALPVAVKG
jgi:CheY-like chemotaxis protein